MSYDPYTIFPTLLNYDHAVLADADQRRYLVTKEPLDSELAQPRISLARSQPVNRSTKQQPQQRAATRRKRNRQAKQSRRRNRHS